MFVLLWKKKIIKIDFYYFLFLWKKMEDQDALYFMYYLTGLGKTIEEADFYEQMIIFKFLKEKHIETKNEEIGRLLVLNIISLTKTGFKLKDYYKLHECKELERGLDKFFEKAVYEKDEFINMYNKSKISISSK